MPQEVNKITLRMPFRMGTVNCYLVRNEAGCILFDTGIKNKRTELETTLIRLGCLPDLLNLMLITHGDMDHISNAAYLREKFGTKIAMHQDDIGMAENGDMSWNREKGGLPLKLGGLLFGFRKADRFTPDITLVEGDSLADFGFDAEVVSLPGHSLGSIGVYFNDSHDLISGDLIDNTNGLGLSSIMDSQQAARESIKKLRGYEINMVYPGHGEPFQWSEFVDVYS